MIKNGLCFFLVILISGCNIGPPTLSPQKAKEGQGGIQKKEKITLSAKVYPLKERGVMSPLSERIQKITVKLDDYVEKGTPLVYFDSTALRNDLLAVQARLTKSRAELELAKRTFRESVRPALGEKEAKIRAQEAELVFGNIKRKLERTRSAYKENAVSKQELEMVENEYVRANAELIVAQLRAKGGGLEERRSIASYQSDVMANEAEYARAVDRLESTTIRAPISGFVTEINIYEGQKVYDGWQLMKIVDISEVIVEAQISPGLLRFVHPGQNVWVTINTVPPTRLSSTINSIRKLVDSESQMCGIKIILPNKDFAFQPGFTSTVEINLKKGRWSEQ